MAHQVGTNSSRSKLSHHIYFTNTGALKHLVSLRWWHRSSCGIFRKIFPAAGNKVNHPSGIPAQRTLRTKKALNWSKIKRLNKFNWKSSMRLRRNFCEASSCWRSVVVIIINYFLVVIEYYHVYKYLIILSFFEGGRLVNSSLFLWECRH